MAGMLHRVIKAVGLRSDVERARLAEVERLFGSERSVEPPAFERDTSRLPSDRQESSQPAGTAKH
jgi:hypothetical protein